MQDTRLQQLTAWANTAAQPVQVHQQATVALQSVSGDASFRRYFRLTLPEATYIAVDAPPAQENSKVFVQVARLLRDAKVCAPQVFAVDYDQGFMLLEDFGDTLYLEPLLQAQALGNRMLPERLYQDAIVTLVALQKGVNPAALPAYDRERLHNEMALFETWFCEALLELKLHAAERTLIAATFRFLEDAALAQPQVAVHRDYHSRNLLVLPAARDASHRGPGVIDFQDAVTGAYTYDLVSLLRDCYISWDEQQVELWAQAFLRQAASQNLFAGVSDAQFQRDFDLMGLQRHLKVMGIFSRLSIRDNKPRYLADIPLVARYFLSVSERYEELLSFRQWFAHTVLPVARVRLDSTIQPCAPAKSEHQA